MPGLDAGNDRHLRPKVKRLQSTSYADPAPGSPTLVAAAVWSEATLRAARDLPPGEGAPDLLELRVDAVAGDPAGLDALEALAAGGVRPLIVTVRHPAEGGLDPALGFETRHRLYERFLPPAGGWVDIELRSLRALADVATRARERGCRVIASFHDFEGTPGLRRLRELAGRAADAGADVCKVATTVRTPGELARLLDLLGGAELPLAVMGMGPLGKASRLTLAAAGSVLAYGYLGEEAQVPGQWPAARLRELLTGDELA